MVASRIVRENCRHQWRLHSLLQAESSYAPARSAKLSCLPCQEFLKAPEQTEKMHRISACMTQLRSHVKIFTFTPFDLLALCILRSFDIRGLCKQYAPSGHTRPRLHQSVVEECVGNVHLFLVREYNVGAECMPNLYTRESNQISVRNHQSNAYALRKRWGISLSYGCD